MLRKKLSPSIGKWRRNHVWRLKEEWVAGAMLDLIDRPLKKVAITNFSLSLIIW
jgi:hypothetical protein